MSNIVLHPGQSQIFKDLFIDQTIRYATAVCSRGWGKSYFAGTAASQAVFELMELPKWVPHKNVYIIAPTYTQVTDIYYPLLAYELGLKQYAIKDSKDLGRFWFPNEVELRLVSYEAIERLRGTGAYFVVLDEVSSWSKGGGLKDAWQGIIQPCLATRWSPKRAAKYNARSAGRALTISTPKGFNFLYDMYNYPEVDKEWGSYHFDYNSSPYLDPDEIERIKHTIDPLQFAREYLASFEESGNRVFYCFDRKLHVDATLPDFKEKEDVHVGIDFNVGIQASSFFAVRGGQVHYLDETQGHPDTDTLAKAIKAKYIDKGHKVHAYPDPTGNSRKTSAAVGSTDFSILKSYGIRVNAPTGSPSLVDSAQCVNRMLKTAAGEVNLYVHPRCVGTITSLERTVWTEKNPDIATIDKKEGVEHFSDNVRYSMSWLFPIVISRPSVARGFGF
jgi:hypothetical protein